MLHRRSDQRELMDDLDYQGDDLGITLKELDFINRWLGGDTISMSALDTILKNHRINSIVDLGCGSGKFLYRVLSKYPEIACTGVDANPAIIDLAQKNYPAIEFICQNILSEKFAIRRFDIIHCCLFLHHFTNEELIDLFGSLKKQARVGIMVNDLHRHFLAYYAIQLLTSLFSKSRLVRHDAKLSVQRGFNRTELEHILSAAGIKRYHLRWKWAFRWQLIIYS
ncbi:MAG: methyltransferase domain-containing protein [Cyclobacteriaceae bacterium]|nr:methyltransferase domain-containing protein [Cyclobacteriaceae bacterium SS2]